MWSRVNDPFQRPAETSMRAPASLLSSSGWIRAIRSSEMSRGKSASTASIRSAADSLSGTSRPASRARATRSDDLVLTCETSASRRPASFMRSYRSRSAGTRVGMMRAKR